MLDLLHKNRVSKIAIDEFKRLITLCIGKNICAYRGTTYEFPDGLPMGAPLSSLVADVFVDHFENKLFSGNLFPNVLKRFRYVDDILCIWNGPVSELELFHNHLNSLEPSIDFTLEIGGSSINFLDLTITLRILTHDTSSACPPPYCNIVSEPAPHTSSNALLSTEFAVFRKPFNSGVLIHGDSLHPYNQKLAPFSSMIHRLISLPLSPVAFQAECLAIAQLAFRNNIQLDLRKNCSS